MAVTNEARVGAVSGTVRSRSPNEIYHWKYITKVVDAQLLTCRPNQRMHITYTACTDQDGTPKVYLISVERNNHIFISKTHTMNLQTCLYKHDMNIPASPYNPPINS